MNITLLVLVGCYDFAGDEGRIGFVSDLQTTSGTKWTPEYGIAGGSDPTFYAVMDLESEDEEELAEVWGQADGVEFSAVEPFVMRVEGIERGRADVVFEGEIWDAFELRFRPASELVLVDVFGEELDDFVVAQGGETALGIEVRDRWSRPLGVRPDDVIVEADGGVSAWMEEGYVALSADDAGGLTLDVAGTSRFAEIRLGDVHHTEIVVVHQDEEVRVLQHRAWDEDGVRVLGAAVSWPEGAEVLGPDRAAVAR